ncbi:glycine-rich cell wall structural protein 1-like [Cryptomeria japonica]|uniref:glycine-rich cell wall structural protein 1-like n=1 Tax=Cryptomeria japonica TaxID=3369 RepID=UPI0027DA81F9|nr:glycine-rich cell wall structural protein 1-like [Cryptomeria japonica]
MSKIEPNNQTPLKEARKGGLVAGWWSGGQWVAAGWRLSGWAVVGGGPGRVVWATDGGQEQSDGGVAWAAQASRGPGAVGGDGGAGPPEGAGRGGLQGDAAGAAVGGGRMVGGQRLVPVRGWVGDGKG